MAVSITFCRTCARSRPELFSTIAQLIRAYPNQLMVVELECMAACDDMPALMLDAEYFPRITAQELEQAVYERLDHHNQAGVAIAAGERHQPAR